MDRHIFFSVFLSLATLLSLGQGYQVQSKYFVYLQTEPAQPFYVKINKQKIEANTSGYLILPQLKDGDYKLIVGFLQSKTEEQAFKLKIDSKDKGYLIKDYGAEGWGLFDLQTMSVQKATQPGADEVVATPNLPKKEKVPNAEDVAATTIPDTDASDFIKVLSKAANDPSLLEKTKPEIEQPVAAKQPKAIDAPAKQETVVASQVVTSKASVAQPTPSDVKLVYDDRNEMGQVDPIVIYIPAPKEALKQATSAAEKPTTEVKLEQVVAEEKPATKTPDEAPLKIINVACKEIADENDFLKLRRTMAMQGNDDSMIEQAEKSFSNKCYTTAHLKYLSSMFLSNAGKYNFFAAAQPHVADKENFASLASEIKDEGYKNKFNKLLQSQ